MRLMKLPIVGSKAVLINPEHVVMVTPYAGKRQLGDPEYQTTVHLRDSHFADTVLSMVEVEELLKDPADLDTSIRYGL